MSNLIRVPALRQSWVAVRLLLIATVVLGILYPIAITGVAQLAFPGQANGSLLSQDGHTIGSRLLGQSFTTKSGAPDTHWFQSRPSATGYDASTSGASNLGPNSADLLKTIRARQAVIARTYHVAVSAIPADAVTASASGLDPDISPAYALLQAPTVARTRGLSVARVEALVRATTQGRWLGVIGEPTVNVLELNAALAKMN